MSLEINFKQGVKSWPQHISLENGESLQVFAGEIFQIINPENVAQLVPQATDLQIVCHDGSSYILKSFMNTEFSQEPTLELKEGTSITWHDFVQQSEGVDMDDMPDDQYSQSILFAPLHVIALASESQKWGFSQFNPDAENKSEESGPAAVQPQSESQTEDPEEAGEDYQAASIDTTVDDPFVSIEQDPQPVSGNRNEGQGEDTGIAPYTTSTNLNEIEIDIREFIPQLHEDEVSDDLTITAKFQDDPVTVIEIDPKEGALRLPGDTFDDDGQRRLTVTINDKDGKTETEITITETKDGGGEAFHLILSHNQVTENIEGALIGKLDTDDSGRGGDYTYRIEKDDSGLFEIEGNVLKLKDGVSIDYEAQPDNYPVIISSTDEAGNRIEQTLSVWPEDVNEAATVSSVGIQSFEDLVVSFQPEPFEDSFEDEDSDYLEMIRVDTLPDNGVLLLGDSKVDSGQLIDIEQVEELAFHPDINWNGNTEFTWSGFDGQSWSKDSSPVHISVESVNDAPVVKVNIGSESIVTDAAFILELPQNAFIDMDAGDSLSYSAELPNWLSIDPSSGKLSGIPGEGAIGEHGITISATDSEGATASQSFSISVAHANTAPTLTPIANQSTAEDALFNFDASEHFQDSDEGDSLTYSASTPEGDPLPSWLSFDSETGQFTGTPSNEDVGFFQVKVSASDGEERVDQSFTLTVENTNDAPTLVNQIDDATATEDAAFSLYTASNFEDQDLGDTLTLSVENTNDGPIATVAFDDQTAYEDSDFSLDTASTFADEDLDDGPFVTTSIGDQTTDEDAGFSLDVSGKFDDEDFGDTLTFTATLDNGDPLPSWLAFDSETGELSGTPRNDDIGDLNIKVVASDGEADASQDFTLNIENTNDAPTLTSQITDESITEDAPFSLDVSPNFADVDAGDELMFEATQENGDPLPEWLNFDEETGTFSGQPGNDDVGDLSITVTVTDGIEIVSDTFFLSVENTNDGPVVSSSIQDQTTDEDSSFFFDASNYFTDEDLGDTLTYSATLGNGDPLPDWLSINENTGELSGTPADADNGDISIRVVASDGEAQAEDTFTLTVNDAITGSDPDQNINGGNGAQTIVTGSGNDTIDGGEGADTISSGAGNDQILGGSGSDNIDAGSGDDIIDGGVGADIIDAGSGDDTIYATEGQDTIHAGEGGDTFIIDAGKNFGDLYGEEGEDTIELDGSGITLDFSKVNNDVTNVERLDIDGSGANSLKLSAEDVLDMTDGNNRLFIDGGSDDSVEISDSFVSQGTEDVDGVEYTRFYDAGTDSHLYINNDISGLDTF